MSKLCQKIFYRDETVVKRVRQAHDVDDEGVRKNIEMLREWLQKQPHLPGDDSDELLEGFLLRNKFNLEATKQKIEWYYTLRGLNKDYFENIDPLSKVMQDNRKSCIWIPIARLTPNLERIFIYSTFGDDSLYKFGNIMLYIMCIQDLKIPIDYCIGDRIIVDLLGSSTARLKTMDVNTFGKTFNMYQKAFSGRLLGMEIVNAPSYLNALLAIMKLAMSKKTFERITIHENLESLHKVVPKECLPDKYGGTLGAIEDLHDEIGRMLVEERETILRCAKRVSDESRRIGEVPENYQFGVDGSFKQLNLD